MAQPATGLPLSGFSGPDAPAEADLYRCVHCGLCLSSCPTYVETALEMESPRGRIALMKAVNEGRVEISPRIVSHWEACLQCRACEAVCPSGVPYGRIMEHTRAQVKAAGLQSKELRRVSRFFLQTTLTHPWKLRLGAHLIRIYQRLGIQKLLRLSHLLYLLPGGIAKLESNLPPMGRKFFGPSATVHPAQGEKKMTVALLSGCVMPLMQGPTMEATVRVLTRNGCDVVVPKGQGCCGALNAHAGDLFNARKMARTNIDALMAAGVERIVTSSAGCGSTMKEYADLLKDDPEYSAKAARFGEMTQDVTELLVGLPFQAPTATVNRKVTYQDPCHLAHAQRITAAPRTILNSIPGLELVEMENSGLCCGGAGIYSTTQPALSQRLLKRKMDSIDATGTHEIITANPGCMLQVEQGLKARKMPGRVRHVVDILDEAYGLE
ncbi:MAG: 4Fe-4S dicluster domain-containing protein [SAR202 cluster bacterium]|nr:4Fe-4S dicluster domain-containing protein [SAR202 cluster bacterium]